MANAQTSKQSGVDLGKLEHRWGKSLIDAGWVGFPSVFLKRQQALGLDELDVNILLQLADHWWERDNLPFPSKKLLADRIGVTPRTIQRRIARMESVGFIKRIERRHPNGGNKTNRYSFDGLIKEAESFAQEELKEREKRKREKSGRNTRKGRRHLRAV
jgi:predicted transcriptional regulator